jgi:hypothetical protein
MHLNSASSTRHPRVGSGPIRALATLVIGIAFIAGCGSTDTVDDPSGGATNTSRTDAGCSPPTTIRDNLDRFVDPEIADRLPEPPPGARICAVDPRTRATEFVTTTPVGREILEYYGPALRANGCDTEQITATGGELAIAGELALDFTCPEGDGSVVAPKSGDRYSIAWRG